MVGGGRGGERRLQARDVPTCAHSHPSDSQHDTADGSLASQKDLDMAVLLSCCHHISLPLAHLKDKRMVVPLETVHYLPKQHKTTLSGQGTACPLKYAHTLHNLSQWCGCCRANANRTPVGESVTMDADQ